MGDMRGLRPTAGGVAGGAAAGAFATVTMDAAMVAASRLAPAAFATDKIGLDVIGRWAGGLGRGRLRHDDIAGEPARRGEVAMGLAAHYMTGIVLTHAHLVALRRLHLRPTPVNAVAYGLVTAVLPLLIMYPSMGYGICGRRSGDARRLFALMLVGHAAFGAGIGLWRAVLSARPPAPRFTTPAV
jgi:hypothetical protein